MHPRTGHIRAVRLFSVLISTSVLILLFFTLGLVDRAHAAISGVGIWLEAEYPASNVLPMQISPHNDASNGRYVSVPNGTGDGGSISFTISIPTTGTYVLWGRTLAPNSNDDAFSVSIDGGKQNTWQLTTSSSWRWEIAKGTANGKAYKFSLSAGTHIIKIDRRDDGAYLDKILITNDLSYVPSGLGDAASNIPTTITLEAESAILTAPMFIGSDVAASGGQYISTPPSAGFNSTPDDGEGTATYTFSTPTAGTYYVWGRTLATSSSSNTFYVQIDGGTYYSWSIRTGYGWKWDRVNSIGGADPLTFNLSAGTHTLKIVRRQINAKLDSIVITQDPRFMPGISEEVEQLADVWSGGSVDFAVVTEGTKQYVGYYNKSRYLVVAARTVGTDSWTYKQLDTQWDGWDSHNAIAMAVDESGTLHVSGNMHADPLNYWRTTTPGNVSTLTRYCMVCGNSSNESQVTYPTFFEGPNGEFLFMYRSGGSGNGDHYINEFDLATKTWSRYLTQPLFASAPGTTMNAYPLDFIKDPQGKYHLVWMWRDTSDEETNHTLSYAQSTNLKDWTTSDGTPLTLPLMLGNAEVLDPTPPGGGLSNVHFRGGFDTQGRLIVSYHKYDANNFSQIYNMRLEADGWHTYQPTNWTCHWDVNDTRATSSVLVRSVEVQPDGRLRQQYRSCDGPQGGGVWNLDEATLTPIAGTFPAIDLYPQEIGVLESTVSSICGYTDVLMNTKFGVGDTIDATKYLLRWQTLSRGNYDDPRAGCSSPIPTGLHLYKVSSTWNEMSQ